MKKITKITATVISSVLALGLVSCDVLFGQKHDPEAKAVDLIKFNFTDAKAIGATSKVNAARFARAAADSDSWQEVEKKYTEDGSSESLVENADEKQKIDFSSFEKVEKVIRNTFSNIPEAASGLYTLFAAPNTSVKYEDGKAAPALGQLIYTKKDGSIVDITEGNYVSLNNAKNKGYDFIEFANTGKAFYLTQNWDDATKTFNDTLWCFNPSDLTNTKIDLGITSKYSIDCFRINKDGSWVFVSTIEDCEMDAGTSAAIGITHVYAVPLNNPANKQDLYTQPTDVKRLCRAGKISYDSCTDMMYFGIDDDVGPGEPEVYLHRSSGQRFYFWNNGYSANNVVNYTQTSESILTSSYNYYKNYANMEEDAVFEQIAKDIKNNININHCDYNPGKGSSNDIEINLSFFADKEEFAGLYNAEAKDGVAVKIIYKALYPNDVDFSQPWNSRDYKNPLSLYIQNYNKQLKDDGSLNAGSLELLPVEKICFLKDADGKSTTTSAVDEKIGKLANGNILMTAEIVSTENGCWGWNKLQNWEGGKLNYTYSNLVQVTDKEGNFVSDYPAALKNVEGYFSWYDDEPDPDAPWYQNPFSVSESGVALISKDRKGIYYFDGTDVENLLEGNENLSAIKMIYTITLENGYLIYTAKTTDDKWITEEINLKDKSVMTFDTTEQISSATHWN